MHAETLITVDVGNSRMKWGLFVGSRLVNTASFPLGDAAAYDEQAARWQVDSSFVNRQSSPDIRQSSTVNRQSSIAWSVASVNPDGYRPLLDWLRDRGCPAPLILDDPGKLPLRIELERPEAVGMDRLLNAVAANERRRPDQAAIVVDCGSAITVDAVSPLGSFLGGAIAPGLGLSARALHEFTYFLPLVSVSPAPEALGNSTTAAMQSGLFWGTVGAVNELVQRIAAKLEGIPANFITGGDASLLAPHVVLPVELAPDLTLHGIYLATQHVWRTA